MRVYYTNQFAITPDMPGGTRHFELSRMLGQRGIETEVFASDLNLGSRSFFRRQGMAQKEAIREVFEGVTFHWLYTNSYEKNDWRRAESMLRFAWNLQKELLRSPKPDVIIGSSPHLFAALAAERAARKFRIPFVFEVRDLWPQTLGDMTGRQGTTFKVLQKIADHLYKHAEKIIVLAKGAEEFLVSQGVPLQKMVYIPNGVDNSTYREISLEEKRALRQKNGLPLDGFLAVYTGAHGRANGLEILLEVAEQLQGEEKIGIVLAGDGQEKKLLVEQAGRKRLKNVFFLPPRPKNEVPELLAAMDMGLLVLRKVDVFKYGISPNKLFDYWAAGLPVLANTPGEIGDLVESSNSGYVVEPENPESLASVILQVQRERSGLDKMGQNGREFVKKNFDRPILADRMAQMLFSLR